MKHWTIHSENGLNLYLIAHQKSFWISHLPQEIDLAKALEEKNLPSPRILRCEEIDKLTFADNRFNMEFEMSDSDQEDVELDLPRDIYLEVKTYVKEQYHPIKVKSLSLWSQLKPLLIFLGLGAVFFVAAYTSAVTIESGEEVTIRGRRAWLKQIVVWFANLLGTTGVLIVGGLFLMGVGYLAYKTIQNPDSGEIIKFGEGAKSSA